MSFQVTVLWSPRVLKWLLRVVATYNSTGARQHIAPLPTYQILLWVVPEVQQALGNCLPILLPLACAEDHFHKVPHPANDWDISQFFLGQDFGVLK